MFYRLTCPNIKAHFAGNYNLILSAKENLKNRYGHNDDLFNICSIVNDKFVICPDGILSDNQIYTDPVSIFDGLFGSHYSFKNLIKDIFDEPYSSKYDNKFHKIHLYNSCLVISNAEISRINKQILDLT